MGVFLFMDRDAGYFLESGHFAIVGRFKDMLIRGGNFKQQKMKYIFSSDVSN